MIRRNTLLSPLEQALSRSRVEVLTGPRQSGKTTLAREFVDEESINYFDLEDPASLARLDEPMTALRPLRGLVVIDEIQRRPELFPVLRVLADEKGNPTRFLILRSASGDLMRQSSESMAWRKSFTQTLLERDLPQWGVRVPAIALRRFYLKQLEASREDDLHRFSGAGYGKKMGGVMRSMTASSNGLGAYLAPPGG